MEPGFGHKIGTQGTATIRVARRVGRCEGKGAFDLLAAHGIGRSDPRSIGVEEVVPVVLEESAHGYNGGHAPRDVDDIVVVNFASGEVVVFEVPVDTIVDAVGGHEFK